MIFKKTAFLLTISLLTYGCGGGDEPPLPPTVNLDGHFKNSNTSGLSYLSGTISGVSDENGKFTYEDGNTVTFSVGGVDLGTTLGKSVVTPIDMELSGTSSSLKVQNITRFLMMLDEDGNPANGFSISSSVQESAQNWSPVDFDSTDLPTELVTIISDARSTDGGEHILPTADQAKTHLDSFASSLRCAYAGAYKGKISGSGTSANYAALVDAPTGYVGGVVHDTQINITDFINGLTGIGVDQSLTFTSRGTITGATLDGLFTSTDSFEGTWNSSLANDSGSFSGSRIGGDTNSIYRLTARYDGIEDGVITFDVDSSNNVTGAIYSATTDREFNLNGALSGSDFDNLTANVSDGTTLTATVNLSDENLTFQGFWGNSANGFLSSFSGNGCKLN